MPNSEDNQQQTSRAEAVQRIIYELREQQRQTGHREAAAYVLKRAVQTNSIEADLNDRAKGEKVFASTVLNSMKHRPEVEQLDALQCNLLDDYEKLNELAGRLEDLFPREK